ncbi:MAG: PAS domain S-box protein [Chloroflexi bacterium]|nr:PAS domain S-box protein [Chloroflexota bacterium]
MTPQDNQVDALLEYIRNSRGFDFTAYKRSTLERRIRRRLQTVSISSFEDYQDYLEVHPEEFTDLFNTIMINVTAFFRDPEAWDFLIKQALPPILEAKSGADLIRVWSAGCASGEEAYTIAIILAELLGVERFRQCVKIYATDVDEDALSQARQATYAAPDVKPLRQEYLERYFERTGSRYSFRPDMRRSVIFGRHDLIKDAPISRLDLLVCRNTLIYLNAETQSRILERFHYALGARGVLFLGRTEMLLTHGQLFSPVDPKHRVFTKNLGFTLRNHVLPSSRFNHPAAESSSGAVVQQRLVESAFAIAPSAQMIIDSFGRLVQMNELARSLFDMKQEDIGRPFHELDISRKPVDLRSVMDQAYAQRTPVRLSEVERTALGGAATFYNVSVSPLPAEGSVQLGVSITFADVTECHTLQKELSTSKQELETSNEELQSAVEELETTNEELQSTVEELETTNEELQSSNEELETMNEELQSTNQELETINIELKARTLQLDQANSLRESILESLSDALVVIGRDGVIQVWNKRAEDLWGLREDEVRGQPFASLDIGLPVRELQDSMKACLSGSGNGSVATVRATTRRGKAIRCKVTSTPLAGMGKELRGVILVMEEEQ